MRTTAAVLLTLLAIAFFSKDGRAATPELVAFDSAPYRLGGLQQRLARERGETPANSAHPEITGYLTKPEGDGPFPGVIFLHGCSGLAKNTRDRISELMTGWGYVSLAVDSFAARNIKEACDRPMPSRLADAVGALAYLSKRPFIDPKRIAVVGASQGGIVVLELASLQDTKLFDISDDLRFRAAVAYYPFCNAAADQLAIPTLVMIGECDDWASAQACKAWMDWRADRGAPVDLIVYPGANHGFDVPSLQNGMQAFGHLLKYDADAARQSVIEMRKFLKMELGR